MDGTLVLWYYDMLGWDVEKLVLTYHLSLHVEAYRWDCGTEVHYKIYTLSYINVDRMYYYLLKLLIYLILYIIGQHLP